VLAIGPRVTTVGAAVGHLQCRVGRPTRAIAGGHSVAIQTFVHPFERVHGPFVGS